MRQLTQQQARCLLLSGQGLSGPRLGFEAMLEQLGFIQLDSINAVARAHELTLHARCPDYTHEQLFELLPARQAFEHWTHDASLMPPSAWPYWSERCRQRGERILRSAWWRERMGPQAQAMLDKVRQRLAEEGPLQSRDFENRTAASGGWWNWKPEKAALEYLWHSGEISVVGRRNFQKVYDLSHQHLGAPQSEAPSDLVDWACRGALQRLGLATVTELAAYWQLVSREKVGQWCRQAVEEGVAEAVLDSQGRPALAVADWAERALPPKSKEIRLLAPFDPILRDRQRAQRLFDFDFRFEAFVPAAQRQHGYYTLPILEGQSLVGRLTPKMDRKQKRLLVLGLHWESGVRVTAARLHRLQKALDRLAAFLGASTCQREISVSQEAGSGE